MRRHHGAVMARLEQLAERGRREGAFRDDVPAAYLAAVYVGLVHTTAGEVAVGRLAAGDALEALTRTLQAAFTA